MKKKVFVPIIIVLILAIFATAWYFTPKTFAKGINPDDVDHFSVFDGQTGTGFQVTDPAYVKMIVRNLQNTVLRRSGISLGRMGYGFSIEGVDKNGKSIIPILFINDNSTIRKDPFFYSCGGELCFDFLKELEPDLSVEVSLPDDAVAISIDGVTYFGIGLPIPVEPDESVIEYVEIPAGHGDVTITAFARMEEGKMIACLIDGEWYRFHSMEALASSQVNLEN